MVVADLHVMLYASSQLTSEVGGDQTNRSSKPGLVLHSKADYYAVLVNYMVLPLNRCCGVAVSDKLILDLPSDRLAGVRFLVAGPGSARKSTFREERGVQL